jgi:hypothetical protein
MRVAAALLLSSLWSCQMSAIPADFQLSCTPQDTCPNNGTCVSGCCVADGGPATCCELCNDGGCTCTPQCSGKSCGDDGCGGTCGSCGMGEFCSSGKCVTTTVDFCADGDGQQCTDGSYCSPSSTCDCSTCPCTCTCGPGYVGVDCSGIRCSAANSTCASDWHCVPCSTWCGGTCEWWCGEGNGPLCDDGVYCPPNSTCSCSADGGAEVCDCTCNPGFVGQDCTGNTCTGTNCATGFIWHCVPG